MCTRPRAARAPAPEQRKSGNPRRGCRGVARDWGLPAPPPGPAVTGSRAGSDDQASLRPSMRFSSSSRRFSRSTTCWHGEVQALKERVDALARLAPVRLDPRPDFRDALAQPGDHVDDLDRAHLFESAACGADREFHHRLRGLGGQVDGARARVLRSGDGEFARVLHRGDGEFARLAVQFLRPLAGLFDRFAERTPKVVVHMFSHDGDLP